MEAKELRIGNYFKFGELIHTCKPCDILNIYQSEIAKTSCDEYNPIELTPEILEKCGFIKIKSNYELAECFDYMLQPIIIDMANNSIKINGVYQNVVVPEYLHQLQNLYFDLTGKELEINL